MRYRLFFEWQDIGNLNLPGYQTANSAKSLIRQPQNPDRNKKSQQLRTNKSIALKPRYRDPDLPTAKLLKIHLRDWPTNSTKLEWHNQINLPGRLTRH